MKLFHIILKMMINLHLVTSDEHSQLKVDVEDWEESATLDSDKKLKKLYAKLHQGVAFRLFSPFLYIFLINWTQTMLSTKDDRDFDELP